MSLRALSWAAEEARLRDAALEVVNAWRAPYIGGNPLGPVVGEAAAFVEASEDLVRGAIDTIGAALPARVERVSARGSAAAVILDVAKGADVVVMGSRGRGGFKATILGSTTNQVTHHAPCPVVVIRDAEQE